jgi:HAMP domain-containing protein
MGIRPRIIVIMGIFSLIATLIIGTASYKLTERNAIIEAKNKGQLLFHYILAYSQYFKSEQRALIMELVEEDRFYPELMSGFVVTRGIWDVFQKENKGYEFKQATLNPLYQPNKADSDEVRMIDTFRESPDLKMMEGVIDKNGEKFFFLAYPIKIDAKECLQCHGDPTNAPRDQIEIYGTENGYHWQYGDTVSAYIIYVSIQDALASAKRMAGMLFLVGIGCFFLALLAMALFLDRSVIQPIEYLSDRIEEISQGKNLQESFKHEVDDEIGILARAIEHLRLSMIRLDKGKEHGRD